MELQNKLKVLADKIVQMKDKIGTEEATKNAFIMPFINILGYDLFDPTEVIPEFTADLGLKKGEKVDYAIFQNGEPILIIECKNWKEDLNVHNSQLFRYFHVTKTRFALLTNGIEYKFYSDLEESNKMDEKPFLEFNVCGVKESTINEIAKFHKSNFDVNKIVDNASSLKYTKEIKKILDKEFQEPSTEFVRHFANPVYSGRLTEKVMEQFRELVLKATNQYISEKVNDRRVHHLTNSGNEFEVFAFIKQCLQMLIDKKKPKEILFSSSKSEENRTSLYSKLIKKLPGYNVEIDHEDSDTQVKFKLVRK